MTRDDCTLCGGKGHHPAACPLRNGMDADPPDDAPTIPPKAPELPDYGYFSCFDIARMERAIAGPRWTMPPGLSREQMREYITRCANGEIPPDKAAP